MHNVNGTDQAIKFAPVMTAQPDLIEIYVEATQLYEIWIMSSSIVFKTGP